LTCGTLVLLKTTPHGTVRKRSYEKSSKSLRGAGFSFPHVKSGVSGRFWAKNGPEKAGEGAKRGQKWPFSGRNWAISGENETGAKTSKERPPDTCSMSLNSSRRVESTSQTAASTGHGNGRRLWREMWRVPGTRGAPPEMRALRLLGAISATNGGRQKSADVRHGWGLFRGASHHLQTEKSDQDCPCFGRNGASRKVPFWAHFSTHTPRVPESKRSSHRKWLRFQIASAVEA
jgi:hypothetical protein